LPVKVDHEKDDEVKGLFERIEREQNGQLDILVNNAFKGGEAVFGNIGKRFWECEPTLWDDVNNVGLRNHYICAVYAARMMVKRKKGLIVNITSLGGTNYAFNVAYGVGKAAIDRMSVDCGIELKKYNVCSLGLLLGTTKTEFGLDQVNKHQDLKVPLDPNNRMLSNISMKAEIEKGESIEFPGKCVVALAQEKDLMKYNAKVVIAADYAQGKGIKDIDNKTVPSHRQVNALVSMVFPQMGFVAKVIPDFVKIPQVFMDLAARKIK